LNLKFAIKDQTSLISDYDKNKAELESLASTRSKIDDVKSSLNNSESGAV